MKQLSKEQVELIKKPLPREAVTPHPSKQNLSTIKAIYVTERLNDVFGIGQWTIKTDAPWDDKVSMITEKVRTTQSGRERLEFTAVLKTILEVPEYGIYYECIASSTNDDAGDACKGATTDAITKICSYIGIGIDVFKGKHDIAVSNYESTVVDQYIAHADSLSSAKEITDYAKSLADDIKSNPKFRTAISELIKQAK